MKYKNLIKIASNALLRNKFRAILTCSDYFRRWVGYRMLSIGQGSKKSIQEQISSMGSNMVFVMPGQQRRGGVMMGNSDSKSLTLKNVEALEKESKYLSAISPQVASSGQAVRGNNKLAYLHLRRKHDY
jgi:putative ABC transport system permease protein